MYKPYTIQCLFTQFGIRQIFRVFLSKDTDDYEDDTRVLISTLLHIDIPYIVRSLLTLRKCWSVQMISVPCVSKSNMQRFCMNLRSPRKTATSPQTKDLSRGPPEQIGLSLTFLCKLAVKPMPRKNDKNHFLGLKYRVDQYREKNQRKALPVCLNKN